MAKYDAAPRYVNLNAPVGGYESQLADIARRQKYAELLAQQGGEDIKVEDVGGSTSNLSSSVAAPFQVGAGGFGVTFNIAGTNSVTTTNSLIRFDVAGDGVNWVANALTVNYTPSGTSWTPGFTNILSTAANVGNLSLARIASIQNTNLASIFVTNITITTR